MSLKSKIQALITAANAKTGETDATLTDAVQSLVDGYGGITPTGNINITDTNVTDVTNYATATVVDADLVAENIKKDVNILGIIGTFEGGGGGLPTSISKIDGGSFTVATDTQCDGYNIPHTLGQLPKGLVVWTTDNSEAVPYAVNTLIAGWCFASETFTGGGTKYQGIAVASYRASNGNTTYSGSWQSNLGAWLNTGYIRVGYNFRYKAGITYNWLAWA